MAEHLPNAQEATAPDDFGLSAVREMIRLISETDITELIIERGDTKLHIKRGSANHAPTQSLFMTPSLAMHPGIHAPLPPPPAFHSSVPAPEVPPTPVETLPEGKVIAAPMVGTYYHAPSPKDAAYVEEGDLIQVGDRVGIIEAMKMMNEIESDVAGRVARILVKNGQSVEYGQPLMLVEPA